MKPQTILTKSLLALLAFHLALIVITAHAQSGLDLIQATGRALVDTPINPTALQLDLNVQFLPSPHNNGSNGTDPLKEDIRATVFFDPAPCFIVFIPAGSLKPVWNGYALREGANVQLLLATPPAPGDPNPQPQIVDLRPELQSLDVRMIAAVPTDPCFFRIQARFSSQAPEPCFIPLNRAALTVRLDIGDDAGSADITRINVDSGPSNSSGQDTLLNMQAKGQIHIGQVDDALNPTQLRLEWNVRFHPSPNSNGIHPLAEDLLFEAAAPVDPCYIVFVPKGSFLPKRNGFVVPDPIASGVKVLLVTQPGPNDPNPQPQIIDLTHELQSIDLRLIEAAPSEPCFFRIEAHFASQAPAPCFIPLNRAPQTVGLRIGDDTGVAEINAISYAALSLTHRALKETDAPWRTDIRPGPALQPFPSLNAKFAISIPTSICRARFKHPATIQRFNVFLYSSPCSLKG